MLKSIIFFFRLLIFIIVFLVIILIVDWGFEHLLNWLTELWTFPSRFKGKWWTPWFKWVYVILNISFGLLVWNLFKIIGLFLISPAYTYITPKKEAGFWIVSSLFTLNCGYAIYKIWTIQENYNSWQIFVAITATIAIIEFTYNVIMKIASLIDKD
jgi:hypothetical protein